MNQESRYSIHHWDFPLNTSNHGFYHRSERCETALERPWPSKSCILDTTGKGSILYQPGTSPKNRFYRWRSSILRSHGFDMQCRCYRSHQQQWQIHTLDCSPAQPWSVTKRFLCRKQCEVHFRIDLLRQRHRKCVDGRWSQRRCRWARSVQSLTARYRSRLFRQSSCKQAFHPNWSRLYRPGGGGHCHQ